MAERQRTEHLEQLEERVNRRVRETIEELRTQVRERLQRAAEQIGEVAEGLGETDAPLPESFFPREDLASWSEEAEAGGRLGGELVEALSAIDGAAGQSELLDALAAEAGRFASRTAVLVAREEGAASWSSHGWNGATGTTLEYSEDGPWSPDRFGRGAQTLGSGACGELCGRLDAPLPAEGVLVPLVLRDRVAALLYADRAEDAPPLRREALQVLTYAAALALETQPFRERSRTATLVTGDGLDEASPLWPAAAPPSEAEADILPAPDRDEDLEDLAEPAADELPDSALSDAGLASGAAYEDAAAGGWQLDEGAEPAVEPPPWKTTAPEEIEVEAGHQEEEELTADELEEVPADDSEGSMAAYPAEQPAAPVEGYDAGESDADGYDEARADDDGEAEAGDEGIGGETEGLEPWERPAEESAAPEPEQEPEPEPEPEPESEAEPEAEPIGEAYGSYQAEAPYEAAEEPGTYGEAEEAPIPEAASETSEDSTSPVADGVVSAPAAGSVEVQPPTDVEGPGRAFAGSRTPEGDPVHEEARRLARLLVSEIRLYNEEEVEAGRRTGDVYERLKEDIDRSRQMYEDRVDPGVRDSTDYFYQELVRNLGGGDAKALGI